MCNYRHLCNLHEQVCQVKIFLSSLFPSLSSHPPLSLSIFLLPPPPPSCSLLSPPSCSLLPLSPLPLLPFPLPSLSLPLSYRDVGLVKEAETLLCDVTSLYSVGQWPQLSSSAYSILAHCQRKLREEDK